MYAYNFPEINFESFSLFLLKTKFYFDCKRRYFYKYILTKPEKKPNPNDEYENLVTAYMVAAADFFTY